MFLCLFSRILPMKEGRGGDQQQPKGAVGDPSADEREPAGFAQSRPSRLELSHLRLHPS